MALINPGSLYNMIYVRRNPPDLISNEQLKPSEPRILPSYYR